MKTKKFGGFCRMVTDNFTRFVDNGFSAQRQTDLSVHRIDKGPVIIHLTDLLAGFVNYLTSVIELHP